MGAHFRAHHGLWSSAWNHHPNGTGACCEYNVTRSKPLYDPRKPIPAPTVLYTSIGDLRKVLHIPRSHRNHQRRIRTPPTNPLAPTSSGSPGSHHHILAKSLVIRTSTGVLSSWHTLKVAILADAETEPGAQSEADGLRSLKTAETELG